MHILKFDELLRENCEIKEECRGHIRRSVKEEIFNTSSFFTILNLKVLHNLLGRLTFYKAGIKYLVKYEKCFI
jgi:hypothetical protein